MDNLRIGLKVQPLKAMVLACILAFFLAATGTYIMSSRAFAEVPDPFCYVGLDAYRLTSCDLVTTDDGSNNAGFYPPDNPLNAGPHPVAGKCYGVIMGYVVSSRDSEECRDVIENIETTAATPARCFTFDTVISNFFSRDFNSSQIRETTCTDELKQKATAHQTGFDWLTGGCYLFSTTEDDYTSPTCSYLMLSVSQQLDGPNTSGQGDVSNGSSTTPSSTGGPSYNTSNPTREDALNCTGADCFNKNPIVILLKNVITFVSVAIGVIVTVVIVWAGVEYATSGSDPNKTAGAKNRIKNAIIALVAYIFLWALMQWLIPGSPF